MRYGTTSKRLVAIVFASWLQLLGGESSFGQIAPGAPGGIGMGGAAPGGFAMGAGGANGAGFGMGAGGAGSGFTGSGVGVGTVPPFSGVHIGTMLPGPRGNTIQQSPGVNGFGSDIGISGLGISGGIVPTPRFGEPLFGRIQQRGNAVPMGRGRGPIPGGADEQAVYFAKRGDYEDSVYRTRKRAYRRNEASRSAGSRTSPRRPPSQTRSE